LPVSELQPERKEVAPYIPGHYPGGCHHWSRGIRGRHATTWNDPSDRDSGLEMYLDMKAIKVHFGEALLVLKIEWKSPFRDFHLPALWDEIADVLATLRNPRLLLIPPKMWIIEELRVLGPSASEYQVLWDIRIAVVPERGDELISAEADMICMKSRLWG
jgi:hypothetical protein